MAISIGILTLGSVILLMAAYRNPILYAQCLSMTWCFSQTCRWPDSLLFDTGPASATWCFSSVYLFNLYFRAIDIIYNCVAMTSLCVWTSLPSFIKKNNFSDGGSWSPTLLDAHPSHSLLPGFFLFYPPLIPHSWLLFGFLQTFDDSSDWRTWTFFTWSHKSWHGQVSFKVIIRYVLQICRMRHWSNQQCTIG